MPSDDLTAGGDQRGLLGGHGLEGHDDHEADVEQDAEPAGHEDRQEPEHPHEGRIQSVELGKACGDPGDPAVMAAAIETAVHEHPPIGWLSRVSRSRSALEVIPAMPGRAHGVLDHVLHGLPGRDAC